MKPAVISFHSFVDVITNSSSELFICETKKSVDAVKEVLIELAKLHNEKQKHVERSWGDVHVDHLFSGVFREPEVAEYSFNFHHFPRSSEWVSMFGNPFYSYGFVTERVPTHPVLEAAHEEMSVWSGANPSVPWADKEELTKAEYKKADAAYWVYHKKKSAAADKIYAKWHAMTLEITGDLHKWAAEQNNIDLKPLGEFLFNSHGGEYSNLYYKNVKENSKKNVKEAYKFVEKIDHATSWGYTFNKGDIFLHSADDNSVPYGFWPDIESAFGNVQRRHLG